MAKFNKTTLACIGVVAAAALTPLALAAPINSEEIQTPMNNAIRYNNIPEVNKINYDDKSAQSFKNIPQKRLYRSYEHEHENDSSSEHHPHSDHINPQQTYGSPVIGVPFGGLNYGGLGRESITAIAANGAGASASAKVGLVSLAGIIGAAALF